LILISTKQIDGNRISSVRRRNFMRRESDECE
jgi:hypothetical protein